MESVKILERHHYSDRTLSVFQVVAAYFTNIYYNHLYIEAQKAKAEGHWDTVTLSYRHACNAFLTAIDYTSKKYYKVENYTQLLMGITEHFKKYTAFSTMSINECIDKVIKEFIPSDFFATTDRDTRRNIIRNILTGLIRNITALCTTDFLVPIIDHHKDKENAPAILEKIVDLLLYERELMYHKFTNGGRPKQAERAIVERVGGENKKLSAELEAWKMRTAQILADLKVKTEQLSELVAQHSALHEKHRATIEELGRTRSALQTARSEPRGPTVAVNHEALTAAQHEIQRLRATLERATQQERGMSIRDTPEVAPRNQPATPEVAMFNEPEFTTETEFITPEIDLTHAVVDESPFTENDSVALAIKRAESVRSDPRVSFFNEPTKPKRSARKLKRVDDDELLVEEPRRSSAI